MLAPFPIHSVCVADLATNLVRHLIVASASEKHHQQDYSNVPAECAAPPQ